MDLTTAIEKRRSIRRFLDKPVEIATIGGILEIAKEAPSAGNVQNWRFIIITDKKIKAEIANICAGQTWIAKAPALIAICADSTYTKKYKQKSEMYDTQNTAIITTLIMLKAAEIGLGTCWVGTFDEKALSGILRLPSNIKPYVVLPIGYPHPDEKYKAHKRYSIDKLTYFNRYGYHQKLAPKQKEPFLKKVKRLIKRK